MSERIKAYCIQTEKGWCSVLGNHYPNGPAEKDATAKDEITKKARYVGGMLTVQRLCDQTNVTYNQVWWHEPSCEDCARIRASILINSHLGNREEEDNEDGQEHPDESAGVSTPNANGQSDYSGAEELLQGVVTPSW